MSSRRRLRDTRPESLADALREMSLEPRKEVVRGAVAYSIGGKGEKRQGESLSCSPESKKSRRELDEIMKKMLETAGVDDIPLNRLWLYLSGKLEFYECPYCYEEIEQDRAQTSCGHYYHEDCIKAWINSIHEANKKSQDPYFPTCPQCRDPITKLDVMDQEGTVQRSEPVCDIEEAIQARINSLYDWFIEGIQTSNQYVVRQALELKNPENARDIRIFKNLRDNEIMDKLDFIARPDDEGDYPIHHASRKGDVAIMKMILDKDPNRENSYKDTAIETALAYDHSDIVELLIDENYYNSDNKKDLLDKAIDNNKIKTVDVMLDKGFGNFEKAFSRAIWTGWAGVIEVFLKRGADPNEKDYFDNPLFFDVTKNGNKDIVGLFLAYGADVNMQDGHGHTALMIAARYGYTDIIELLIEKGAKVDIQDKDGDTALILACAYNHVDTARMLIDNDADETIKNSIKQSAMHSAYTLGHYDIVELLMGYGVEIDPEIVFVDADLIAASREGRENIVKPMLERTDNVKITKEGWKKALFSAAKYCHKDIVEMLLKKTGVYVVDSDGDTALFMASENAIISVDVVDSDGDTALMMASENGCLDVARFLLETGADANTIDKYGHSALMKASEKGHEGIVRLLIDNGAEIDAVDYDGNTSLMLAVWEGHIEIVRLLIDNGAKLNTKNDNGDTALIMASRDDNLDMVRLLVENGIDVNAKNNDGVTALMLASRKNNMEIVQLLAENGANVHAKNNNGTTVAD